MKGTNEMVIFNLKNEGKVEPINKAPGYEIITFNGVNLYVKEAPNEALDEVHGLYFNATKLFKTFKNYTAKNGTERVKASFYSWINGAGKGFKTNYPNYFINVFGKGTQEYKGVYVHFNLFLPVVLSIDAVKTTLWLNGQEWKEEGNEGYLYVCQTERDLGSNIYKIGATKSMKTRINNLGIASVVYGTIKVSDKYKGELLLKDAFNKNDKCRKVLERGNEYYEVDDINVVYDTFLDMDLLGLNLEVPKIYEKGEFSIREI